MYDEGFNAVWTTKINSIDDWGKILISISNTGLTIMENCVLENKEWNKKLRPELLRGTQKQVLFTYHKKIIVV